VDAETATVVERLRAATNAHDLDAIVECFSETYRNETPAHPGRGFTGRAQVRSNWQHILAGVPDVTADVIRMSVDGDVIWSEWEMRGTRRDGQRHEMRGVIIFGIADNEATWARFYLEPVDAGDESADGAVRQIVAGQS
jgi:ketosteroid isomerase-like protein